MSDEEGQELVTKPFKFVTAGETSNKPPSTSTTNDLLGQLDQCIAIDCELRTDARFPNVNQTKHCWQNYVDYHKCIIAKGEDFAPCRQFWLAYRSLCPSGWYQRWDEQRESGNFPVKFDA